VLATSDPDLLIESVEFDSEKMIVGSVNEIKVWVRNDGWSPASLVSIRCFNGQTLIDSANITHISAQGLESASCYWQLPMDPGNTSLRVYVDPTHDIFEISETNNEHSSSVQVLPLDNSANTGVQQDAWMANLPSGVMWIAAASIILAAIIALQLGPGKIRREI
jgi:subtilase family serine protease